MAARDGRHSGRYALRQRRTSTAATTDALVHAVKTLEARAESTLLLLWDDLPAWRRDNAFIRSGYRSATRGSYACSLRSLFYLHNESVNIWSHLVGALAAAAAYLYCAIRPRYASASPADLAVFACFFGGAVVCLGMSATFHALLDHSEEVARWGNKLDYTGIVALIVGSYVPALYYAFRCQPLLLAVYLSLVRAPGTASLPPADTAFLTSSPDMRPRHRMRRRFMDRDVPHASLAPLPSRHVHRARRVGSRPRRPRRHRSRLPRRRRKDEHFLGHCPRRHVHCRSRPLRREAPFPPCLGRVHGAVETGVADLEQVRWPERSFPGAFDIWGSSHQIFHVCVLLAAATHFYGMTKAFDHHHSVMGSQCPVES